MTDPHEKSYYTKGSVEEATETPVTLQRLEARRKLTKNSTRLVIALVGLPARGKSFIGRKLLYYLNWSGVNCKVFNVGKYRREAYAQVLAAENAGEDHHSQRSTPGACDANFFDSNNTQAAELREKVAWIALEDMLHWLDGEDEEDDDMPLSDFSRHSTASTVTWSNKKVTDRRNERIAIFDATNSTHKRRQWLLEMCTSPERRPGKPTGVVFVESICDDVELLEENYRYKVSVSPDFGGMSQEDAIRDLKERVRNYEEKYETIDDDNVSYIKIFNLSTKMLCNHIYGRMAKELVPALMAWNIGTRPVFLCRAGQTVMGVITDSEDCVVNEKTDPKDPRFMEMSAPARRRTLRGDSLGPNGRMFREALFDWCHDEVRKFMSRRASVHDMKNTGTSVSGLDPEHYKYVLEAPSQESGIPDPFPMRILTSTMTRAYETVNWDGQEFNVVQMSNLNPLDKGDFAGMELEEIQDRFPEWYEEMERDPYGTRFPGGESYRDLVRRLTSIVIEVEQQVIPTLVVSHLSILQCLMAYFRNTPVEKCMSIEIPMHCVVKYTPVRGGGWKESIHPIIVADEETGRMVPVESASEFSQLSVEESHHSYTSGSVPIWEDRQGSVLARHGSFVKKDSVNDTSSL